MRSKRRGVPLIGLRQAFDEVRFGADRTLNLRESLPSAAEATTRAEAWLRQQQVQQSGEVLVITGRGARNASSHGSVRVSPTGSTGPANSDLRPWPMRRKP